MFFFEFASFVFENRPSPASFSFIFGLFHTTLLLQIIYVKMSIQFMVLGFKPRTFT